MSGQRGFSGGKETRHHRSSDSSNSVCRDFLRNVCNRGSKCRFSHHPPPAAAVQANSLAAEKELLQDSIKFCHDFQNKKEQCERGTGCVFIHATSQEENEFKRSGYLPPHVRDQAIQKGSAPDMPALFGSKPICKDYLKGSCKRKPPHCKFRHLTAKEYDLEMSRCLGQQQLQQQPPQRPEHPEQPPLFQKFVNPAEGNGNPYLNQPELNGTWNHPEYFEVPAAKRGRFENEQNVATIELLQQENMMLKQRIEELKKQVSDLGTTNEFLLDQNAQLRLGVKPSTVTTVVAPPPQQALHPQGAPPPPVPAPPQAPVVTMVTMAVPPPVISMAAVPVHSTSMSMAPPTVDTRQPPPNISVHNVTQALPPHPVSVPPMLQPQALPPPSHTQPMAAGPPPPPPPPNAGSANVQIHETRLVSYPIT